MELSNYLKQFKNIVWYPSALKDTLPMTCLAYQNLKGYGIPNEDIPDCFIFTDYNSYSKFSDNHKFFLDINDHDKADFSYDNSEYKAVAYNVRELCSLNLPFDSRMVSFESDKYYNRVFSGDIFIDHPQIGKIRCKIVYVVVENTVFAVDFLIKKGIKIKYVIHSRYGQGFGGGISNGGFICSILKDLETKYFASDMTDSYRSDVADLYLTDSQRKTFPMLRKIADFGITNFWIGYENVILYEVTGHKKINNLNDFNKRYITI